jgi:DUF4097 and DUF4098 domain-containing protein YvlB
VGYAVGDEVEKTFKAKPGGTLELDFRSGGSAEITGWDKDEIHIVMSCDANDMEDWNIDFDESRDGLTVVTKVARGINTTSLNAVINVPHEYNIKIDSAGGSFEFFDLEGKFTGRTAGGQLVLKDCKGEVRLSSGGGQMHVNDCELDGRMKTGGGKVWVENVEGDFKASSGGGAVTYKNVRNKNGKVLSFGNGDLDVNGETVMIKNAGGKIRVNEAPEGAVVSTGGGNIRVRNADKFVSARTGGGDISIEMVRGWAKAVTGAGDIDVTIEKSGGEEAIILRSGYGDINLTVPEDIGLTFEIDLGYIRESSRDFKIDSDMKLSIVKTDEWEKKNGEHNWWKHIYGMGEVNGGGQKVRIKTTNGNVYIKTD